MFNTDLVPRQTLSQFVEQHALAVSLAQDGLEKLGQAQEIFQAQAGPYAHIIPDRFSSYEIENPTRREQAISEMLTTVQEGFWRRVLKVSGIKDLMGPEDRERMEKMFKEHSTPTFTIENILATLQGLHDSREQIFSAAIQSCFDRLRPRHHDRGYKSNKRDRVGKRVIVSGAMASIRSWNYYSKAEELVSDLDKVFHGLDGKGLPQYPVNAVTAINGGMMDRTGHAETEYFEFRWFQVGSLHIIFKRIDLLQEFNRIAAGGRPEMGAAKEKRHAV
jgi:hypothetical protein